MSEILHTLNPTDAAWLSETFAHNRARFGGWHMEEGSGDGDGSSGDGDEGGKGKGGSEQSFTQADVDRIVADRLKRERETTKTKYADYDDLKARAGQATTLEERVAAMEERATKAEAEALRAKYAADVPEKLRPLLTGTTDEELKAQRDLLVEGESERKKRGNHVPDEGNNPKAKSGREEDRTFVRELFGRANAD